MAKEVVSVYARSIFEVIQESDSRNRLFKDLKLAGSLFSENPGLSELLSAPVMSFTEKTELVNNLFNAFPPEIVQFMLVLIENKRITYFPDICTETLRLWDEQSGVVEITAKTAIPLSDTAKGKLKARLEQSLQKTAEMTYLVEPDLMGSVVLELHGTRVDSSVKTRLEQVRRQLSSVIA